MPDPRSDEIAREAARLIQTGRAEHIGGALRQAADVLGYHNVPLPGHGRVRKHAQAMSMQAMGSAAYADQQRKVLEIAEQIMTVFEHTAPDVDTMFVGRAAKGMIDAGVTIHIRLYTRTPISELAQSLIEFGYDDLAFQTIETRFGRLDQIRLVEEGYEVALTRCMPEQVSQASHDMVTDKPINTLTLAALRRQLDEPSH